MNISDITTLLFIGIGKIKDYPIYHHSIEYADFEGKIPKGHHAARTPTSRILSVLIIKNHKGRHDTLRTVRQKNAEQARTHQNRTRWAENEWELVVLQAEMWGYESTIKTPP